MKKTQTPSAKLYSTIKASLGRKQMKFILDLLPFDPSHSVRIYLLIAKVCVLMFCWVFIELYSAHNAKMPVEIQTQLYLSPGKMA